MGSVGAAAVTAVGLGLIDNLSRVRDLIPMGSVYHPNRAVKPVYDKNYGVFKQLYRANRANFKIVNV